MKTQTILPAPFATVLHDEAATKQLLDDNHQTWQATLDRVAGCVEIGLRAIVDHGALPNVAATATATTGKNYLQQKQEAMQQQANTDRLLADTLNTIHQQLTSLAKDSVMKTVPAQADIERVEMRSIYLVPRQNLVNFYGTIDTLEDPNDAWLTLITDGPFAPYHFVEAPQ